MSKNFKRIFQFAVSDFNRNKGISVAAIFVLVVLMMLVAGIFLFNGTTNHLVSEIKDKIDITAYFKENVSEADILAIREEIIASSPNIRRVDYVSQEQALQAFMDRHGEDAVIIAALQEVGTNPFLPSLNITTTGDPVQYEQVATVLQASDFSDFLDSVDFTEKRDTIERVYALTNRIAWGLVSLAGIVLLIAVLVVFNTVRLAIDSAKEEIATMRIVGASDWFIRGPFIVAGALYGLVAFVISFALSLVVAYALSYYTGVLLPGFSLMGYLLTNMGIFVIIQLLVGVGIGVLSSFVVVRRYLREQ